MDKRHIRKRLWNLENFILLKNKGLRYTQIYNCAQSLKTFHQKLSIPEMKKRFLVTKKKKNKKQASDNSRSLSPAITIN